MASSMTLQHMLEEIRNLFPDVGDTELTSMINRALDEFCEHTRIGVHTNDTVTAQADAIYYALTLLSAVSDVDDVLGVYQVDFDDTPMYRFIGAIPNTDLTEAT